MLHPLPARTSNPATPVKAATGDGDKDDPFTPVAVARPNVYQVPPRIVKTSQKLLPTAKAAAKTTAKAEQPKDQDPPTCCREGCENPTWNGKVVFYCSITCRNNDKAEQECEAPGCTKTMHEL